MRKVVSNTILIVEDDNDLLEALKMTLSNAGFSVIGVTDVDAALKSIALNPYQVVISDINLGRATGLDLLKAIKTNYKHIQVILMTAYGKISDAVLAIQNGAIDYISKPFDIDDLINKVTRALNNSVYSTSSIIYADPQTKRMMDLAFQVAQSDASVLISGESGTGKEIFAQYIHQNSPRKQEPFIALNCAAIPDNMLEAILFGYEKGAFTGAYQSTEGKLEQGNNGTILLDEISEMPLTLQAKLLRVLQEREVERIGGRKTIKLNIRVIATTNRTLINEVENGNFRKDLYFRLNVFPLQIAPLRSRKDDILPLSKHFVKVFNPLNRDVPLTDNAIEKLHSYDWPGNVRELQNVIHRALILGENKEIHEDNIIFESPTLIQSDDNQSMLSEQLMDKENDLIIKVLTELNGNRSASAEKLGISPRTLRYKLSRMKKMGIKIPS